MGRPATSSPPDLPLADGDRMLAAEFFRRYKDDPDVLRAELINGVVCSVVRRGEPRMPPISGGRHSMPQGLLLHWMGLYADDTPGVRFGPPASIRLPSPASVPEPDGFLFRTPAAGGALVLDPDEYFRGVPDMVVEVSNTTAALDLGPKLMAYAEAGIPEYLVFRAAIRRVDWFGLRAGSYVAYKPGADGWLRSRAFPGLWLDSVALIADDPAAMKASIVLGVASPEHAAFAAKLRKKLAAQ